MVSRRGSTTAGCLGWLVVIAAIAFVGSHVAEPYFRYYRYRDAISQRVRFAGVRTDAAIRKDIWAAADSLGLPEEAYHVNIQRDSDSIRISGGYEDYWTLFNYTRGVPFTLNFQGSL